MSKRVRDDSPAAAGGTQPAAAVPAPVAANPFAVRAALNEIVRSIANPTHRIAVDGFFRRLAANPYASADESAAVLAKWHAVNDAVIEEGIMSLPEDERAAARLKPKSAPEGAPSGGRASRICNVLSYVTQNHDHGTCWSERGGHLCQTAHVDAKIVTALIGADVRDMSLRQVLGLFTSGDAAPSSSFEAQPSMHGEGGEQYRGPTPVEQKAQQHCFGSKLLKGLIDQIILLRGDKADEIIGSMRDAARSDGTSIYDISQQWVALAREASGAQSLLDALGLTHKSGCDAVLITVGPSPSYSVNLVLNPTHGCSVFRTFHGRPTRAARESEKALGRLGQTLRALHGLPSVIGETTDASIREREIGSHGWGHYVGGNMTVLEPREDYMHTTRAEAARRSGIAADRLVSLRTAWGTDVAELYDAWCKTADGSKSNAAAKAAFEKALELLQRRKAWGPDIV